MIQENVKSLPSIRFILVGIFLVGAIATFSFPGAYFVAFIYADLSGNATLLIWNRLVYMSLPIVFAVSLAYFSRRQIKHLLPIHLVLVTLVFLTTAGIRTVQLNEQKRILQNCQQFIQLIRMGKTREANAFMHPDYRLTHETLNVAEHTWLEQAMSIEDVSSPYSVHLEGKNRAIIVPDPKTNQWYHPASGIFLELEKSDGEWYFTGQGGLYSED